MPHRLLALIECELLVWARTRARLTRDEAARTVDISPDRLDAWERGDFPPSLEQLKKLAEAYGTRLSVFFLPEPPLDESGYESTRVWERAPRRAAAG